jgi:hypothetical protein
MKEAQAVTVMEPQEPQQPPAVQSVSESAVLLQFIQQAATNPAVDIDKMERLMAMHERILARNAKAAYSEALAEMQPKLPVISERGAILNKSDQVQSRYALWEDIVLAITPILSEHGFALSFRVGRDGDRQTVTGILSHRGGHSEETTLSLPMDMSGSKNAVQGVGSTVSYGKRYTTQSLLNLVSRGEDDDGQSAGGGPNDVITAEQKETLVALLKETNSDIPRFLKYMEVASVDEIKAAHFERARSIIARKKKAS